MGLQFHAGLLFKDTYMALIGTGNRNVKTTQIHPRSSSRLRSSLSPCASNSQQIFNPPLDPVAFDQGCLANYPAKLVLKYLAQAMVPGWTHHKLFNGEEDGRRHKSGKPYIQTVLEKTGGNKARESEILGINRTSLWRMIHRLKIAQ